MNLSVDELFSGVLNGDKRIIGKAITLVESRKAEHRALAELLLQRLMPFTGKSVRIGITGVPGAGKSTFIENFGLLALQKGHKVAVLAIDPSSSINQGSILGDKTRMEELSKKENAFIRPSPTSGFLGGIANTTFETMLICEAAAFDYILIETVGVGQSEVLAADITDVFVMLKLIGGGDELQGIKRGVMEMVDLIFINKVTSANRSAAKRTRQELLRALHFLAPKEKGWTVPVMTGSALENDGLDEVYTKISEFISQKKNNGTFLSVRQQQAEKRFEYWLNAFILERARRDTAGNAYSDHVKKVSELISNPVTEARRLVQEMFKGPV